jgi:hypothetical protein
MRISFLRALQPKAAATCLSVLALSCQVLPDAMAQSISAGQTVWTNKCATSGCHGVGASPTGARANAADAPNLITAIISAGMSVSVTSTEKIDVAAYIESVLNTSPSSASSTWPDAASVSVGTKVLLNWTYSHLTTLETVSPPSSGSVSYSGTTITFTPASAGSFSFTYRARNSGGTVVTSTRTVNVTVAKASQTITFTNPGLRTYGDAPFTASASSDSGLTVALTSITTGVCTVSGHQVTIVAAGTCTINANQAGNVNYNPATQVQQSFTVQKDSQTITFNNPGTRTYGDAPFAWTATSTSGLAVTITSITTGVCTYSASQITIVAPGTCTLNANQAGNSNYNPATQVQQSFTVNKASQTITFGALAGKTYGDPPFTVSATASSGLTVVFTSATTGVCTVSTTTVTIVTGGTCTINANQPGNANYNPAPQVQQSFAVAKASQTITFNALANKTYGDAPFGVSATATSGLTVAFTSSTTAVCTVSGTTVTIVGAGTCTINANQPGNTSYNAAPQVSRSFTVFGLRAERFDLSGDDHADVLWRSEGNGGTGQLYLWPMNGVSILAGEGFTARTVSDLTWKVVAIGDFNGDARADVLWRNSSGQTYIWPMNGTAILASEGFSRTLPLEWQVGGVGDFNGDGLDDIVWHNTTTGQNYLWMMNGTTIISEGFLRTLPLEWQLAGVADFDGDGKADILWRNTSTGQNYLWPMSGTTVLAGEGFTRAIADFNWQVAGIGDFNGDGKADILWRNTATGVNYLWPMSGTTVLASEGFTRTLSDLNWSVASVGDFDGDGRFDILWRHAVTGDNYLWPMNGTAVLAGEGYVRSIPPGNWTAVTK